LGGRPQLRACYRSRPMGPGPTIRPARPQRRTPPTRAEKLNTKADGIVGLAVLCSRIPGTSARADRRGAVGSGPLLDAFTIAFRHPNLSRCLPKRLVHVIHHHFSRRSPGDGDQAAWSSQTKSRDTHECLSAITIVESLRHLARAVLRAGFDSDKAASRSPSRESCIHSSCVRLAALVMGMLNDKNVFVCRPMASSFFNLGSIISGVMLGYGWTRIRPPALWALPSARLQEGRAVRRQNAGVLSASATHSPTSNGADKA